MRFHTYSKFSPEMADAVDLQSLLDKLADFLLQSGFAGQQGSSYYGMGFEEPGDRSLEGLSLGKEHWSQFPARRGGRPQPGQGAQRRVHQA